MHKQAINYKQAIVGGGYLFTENACFIFYCLGVQSKQSRVLFEDDARSSVPVTYDGIPFLIISSDIRECQYGSIRGNTKEVSYLFISLSVFQAFLAHLSFAQGELL